jgi:hypothetical protein
MLAEDKRDVRKGTWTTKQVRLPPALHYTATASV